MLTKSCDTNDAYNRGDSQLKTSGEIIARKIRAA